MQWPVGKWPEGIAFDGSSLWVAESGERQIARLDAASGDVLERARVGRLPVDMLATSDGRVHSLVYTDQLIWEQPRGGRGRQLAKLRHYPEAMVGNDRTLWVLSHPGGSSSQTAVERVDQRTGRTRESDILPANGSDLSLLNRTIWVVHGSGPRGQISLLDARTLADQGRLVVDTFVRSIEANSRGVFVGGGEYEGSGVVIRIDPRTQRETHRASLAGQFVSSLASDDDFIIATGRRGRIWLLSPDDLSIVRVIDLDLGAFEPRKVLPVGDRLYVTMHQGRGESGTMLMVDGWRDGATAGSESPSFQCDTARNPTEQTVCRTRFLAALDTQLSADYDLALGNITSAAAGGTAADVARFRREQRDWLRQRDDCGADVRCIARQYRARLRVLDEMNQPE